MTVDWSIIDDLETPISEISHHSLSHSDTVDGYEFSNFPLSGARISEEWRTIMITGGALHEHWQTSKKNIHSSYIMAPFFGSFIFISPIPVRSGDRTALEMHSMICDEPEHLVREALESVGGVRVPPLSSVGLGTPHEAIEVVSDSGHRDGLSSWLFQLRQFRPLTGVACGIPKNMLKELFPHVKRWITEIVDIPSPRPEPRRDNPYEPLFKAVADGIFEEDVLRYMLYFRPDLGSKISAHDTLHDFRVLEEFSSELEIELRSLIPIHLYETHVDSKHNWPDRDDRSVLFAHCQVTLEDEMKARMILGDREDSLKLLIRNRNLARHWMANSRTRFSFVSNQAGDGVSFPFTKDEVDLLHRAMSTKRAFGLLKYCFGLMSDYPLESKIHMTTILTGLGGQEEIENIWKQVGSVGREGIVQIMPEILGWRENDRISDFWGLLEDLEGGNSTKDLNFRRNVALEVLSNSSKPKDIVGLVGYIPGIILTRENYREDWEILDHLGLTTKRVLLTVNQLQPSRSKIQQRLKLYLKHKGTPKSKWRICSTAKSNGLIPESHGPLVWDYEWMKPILAPIESQRIYGAAMPEDAFYWMQDLSPREYLTCLKDKQLGVYIRTIGLASDFKPGLGWKRPRAIRSVLVTDDEWKINKTWAQLIEQPSLKDRFAYYKGSLARVVGFLSILAMAYCVLLTPPTVDSIGGQTWQGFLMASLAIILGWAVERVRINFYNDGSEPFQAWAVAMAVISLFFISLISILLAGSMDLKVGSLMEVYHPTLALGNLGIHPIPDLITVLTLNPLTTLLLVPMFWQMNRIMTDARSRASKMKEQFYETIEPSKAQKGTLRRILLQRMR